MNANFSSVREIIFYETETGKAPVKDFFDSLDMKTLQKVSWVLRLIKETAFTPKEYFKKLNDTEGIWEVRINYRSNTYRIFSFFDKENLILLTHGIIKKSEKTPKKEIEKAENYRRDYFSRRK